jgi:RNA recognition motif-containing protein
LFGQFGTVKNVRLFYDESGRSDGNATIDFEEPQAASSAEATYNGVELDNHVMRINLVEVKQRPTQDPKFTVKLGGGMSAMRSDGKMAVGINSRIGGKKQQQQATIQDRLGKRVPEGKGKRENSSSGGGAMRTSRGGSGGRGGRGRGDRERGRGSGRGRERKGPLTQADLDMDLDSYMTVN